MIQLQQVDLVSLMGGTHQLIHLSDPNDSRWAGIQMLAPFENLTLDVDARHDIYLLAGNLQCGNEHYPSGSFISRSHSFTVVAGDKGATVLGYRDRLVHSSGNESLTRDQLRWFEGRLTGIGVAQLSTTHHHLSLVSWQPNTYTQPHTHPYGEEIFVLSGELRDERGRYPAGSWLRFYPGSSHAPFVEINTLILLRNGHL